MKGGRRKVGRVRVGSGGGKAESPGEAGSSRSLRVCSGFKFISPLNHSWVITAQSLVDHFVQLLILSLFLLNKVWLLISIQPLGELPGPAEPFSLIITASRYVGVPYILCILPPRCEVQLVSPLSGSGTCQCFQQLSASLAKEALKKYFLNHELLIGQ